MPVGKHRPRSSPRGDSSALCDICGVLWYRSKLVRKADGNLYCPDDIRGLDSTTLAEGNARDAVRIIRQRQVRDSGAQDSSGFPTEEMPSGILLDGAAGARQSTSLTGWWSPRDLRLENGVSNMDNLVNVSKQTATQGNLRQVENGLRPSYVSATTTITYDGGEDEYLVTPSHQLLPITTASMSLWAVGGWTDPSSSSRDFLFHLTDVGGTSTYDGGGEGGSTAHGVWLQGRNGLLTAHWDNTASGSIEVVAPFSSTSLHLFEIRITATDMELYQDGVLLGSTPIATPSAQYELNYMWAGARVLAQQRGQATVPAGHTGVLNELIVYPATVTAAQTTQMNTYFSRTYSGLSIP